MSRNKLNPDSVRKLFGRLNHADYAAVKQRFIQPASGRAGPFNWVPNGRSYAIYRGRDYLGQASELLAVFADLENPPQPPAEPAEVPMWTEANKPRVSAASVPTSPTSSPDPAGIPKAPTSPVQTPEREPELSANPKEVATPASADESRKGPDPDDTIVERLPPDTRLVIFPFRFCGIQISKIIVVGELTRQREKFFLWKKIDP